MMSWPRSSRNTSPLLKLFQLISTCIRTGLGRVGVRQQNAWIPTALQPPSLRNTGLQPIFLLPDLRGTFCGVVDPKARQHHPTPTVCLPEGSCVRGSSGLILIPTPHIP